MFDWIPELLYFISRTILQLVDGLIVVPISTVVFKVQKKLGGDNRLEKLLSRPYALLVISGIIAATFALLVNLKATSFVSNDAEFLTNIPVRVIYNSSAYVIEGIPETVDMTLIGKKYELYLARQLGENEVVVDLTDYQASEKAVRVRLTYSKPIDNLSYQTLSACLYKNKNKISRFIYDSRSIINDFCFY